MGAFDESGTHQKDRPGIPSSGKGTFDHQSFFDVLGLRVSTLAAQSLSELTGLKVSMCQRRLGWIQGVLLQDEVCAGFSPLIEGGMNIKRMGES